MKALVWGNCDYDDHGDGTAATNGHIVHPTGDMSMENHDGKLLIRLP